MNAFYIGFYTLLLREIKRFIRIWRDTLLPPAITMTLYFVIFGRLIGSQIPPIHQYSYIQYITPGLIMMPVITGSFFNAGMSFYLLRFQKSIEEILVSPLSPLVILMAFTLGGVARGIVVGALVMGVSLFFTHLHILHVFIMLLTIFLTAFLFSLAGLLNGILAKSFDDISVFPTFVLTPLSYLGGVFYSLSMLPAIWQKVSLLNPILYLVNAFRYSLLGVTDIPISNALFVISLFILILFSVNYYLLYKGHSIKT